MKSRISLKLILASAWIVFTTSLIVWWWIWALKLAVQVSDSSHRMIKYEGITLISIVIIGGTFLVSYVWQDYKRNLKIQLFFATFSHDIKTSISRLRLQAEIMEEELPQDKHPSLSRFIQDVVQLDLQLENSLLFTNFNKYQFLMEKIKLSQLIGAIRSDFTHLHIELKQDAELITDKKWFLSILKNVFQNSLLHGKASRIEIAVESGVHDSVSISIKDNGMGYTLGPISDLGSDIFKSNHRQSNGIGLYLSKSLLSTMNGALTFSSTSQGFTSHLKLQGKIL
ncbi:MAG: HAMP domain-containing histidine kinase [Moraxellaceae bacterium]|nr:HAMP domain-containing histidine kinase [Pseudobdellovibrionaceae bacterium]